jgi:hypothetical protein
MLNDKMNLCEIKLSKLYNIEDTNDNHNIYDNHTQHNIKNKNKNEIKYYKNETKIHKNTKKNKKIIMKNDDYTEKLMVKYIKENEQKQKEKTLIQNLIINYTLKIFGLDKILNIDCNNDINDIYMLCIAAYRLMDNLNMIGFFDDNFVASQILNDEYGNEYLECISINVYLAAKIKYPNNIKPYFENISIEELKNLYELMLFKKSKIQNLFLDIKKLYCIFGLNLLWTPCTITWCMDENRVVYEQNCDMDSDSDSEDSYCCCADCAEKIKNNISNNNIDNSNESLEVGS